MVDDVQLDQVTCWSERKGRICQRKADHPGPHLWLESEVGMIWREGLTMETQREADE